MRYVRFDVHDGVGTLVLDKQRAGELAMSGREVGGDEALRLGLAMELHAPEQLLARAQAIAASLAQASPTALSLIKRIMASADDLATRLELEADAQALAAGTQAHKEAVRDFLEKRPARYRWLDGVQCYSNHKGDTR